ncbi:hypothetical protein EMIT0158MI4_50367 [Burkholderia ambifaria]
MPGFWASSRASSRLRFWMCVSVRGCSSVPERERFGQGRAVRAADRGSVADGAARGFDRLGMGGEFPAEPRSTVVHDLTSHKLTSYESMKDCSAKNERDCRVMATFEPRLRTGA